MAETRCIRQGTKSVSSMRFFRRQTSKPEHTVLMSVSGKAATPKARCGKTCLLSDCMCGTCVNWLFTDSACTCPKRTIAPLSGPMTCRTFGSRALGSPAPSMYNVPLCISVTWKTRSSSPRINGAEKSLRLLNSQESDSTCNHTGGDNLYVRSPLSDPTISLLPEARTHRRCFLPRGRSP